MVGLRREGGWELHLITNISFNCKKKVHRNAVAKKRVADLHHLSLSFYCFVSDCFRTGFCFFKSRCTHLALIHATVTPFFKFLFILNRDRPMCLNDLDRSPYHDL